MISFPFGYCGGSKEARVNFKYPSSDWDVIVSQNPPALYRMEIIQTQNAPFGGKGQCFTLYNIQYTLTSPGSGSRQLTAFNRSGAIVDFFIENTNDPNPRFCPGGNKVYNTFVVKLTWRDRDGTVRTNGISSGGDGCQPAPYAGYSISNINIIRKDGQPDNCAPPGETQCKFTVTDETGLIYTRLEPQCPDVTIDCGKKCPPNTCECVKGNIVCCYNNQGYVVASFRR